MKGLLVAVTDPVSAERESDYHTWYNGVQIPPFLAMPGITRVIRYRHSATQLNPAARAVPHRFLALYEIEVRDMDGLAAFAERQYQTYRKGSVGSASRGADAYDQKTSRTAYYAEVGKRFERKGRGGSVSEFIPDSVLLVYTDPASGAQEAEYNRWYSEVHLPDVVGVPGFVAATRYILTGLNVGKQFRPWIVQRRYLAVYELEAKGEQAIAATAAALRAQPMEISPALEAGPLTQFYERITEPFQAVAQETGK
jgi:hypothetical protein